MSRNVGAVARNKTKNCQEAQLCADCGATEAEWASINRGVRVCIDCCSVHRSLGRHVSQIKNCKDKDWHPHTWSLVSALSSGGANSVWEHTLLDPTVAKAAKQKPTPSDPVHPVKADFIRTKHQMLSFVIHPPTSASAPHGSSPSPAAVGCAGGGEEEGGRRAEDCDPSLEGDEGEASQELHSSVRTANLVTSLRLLSQGGDPNYFHKARGNYPLHVAASSGQAEQVELLLVYGAVPQSVDGNGSTPAQCASIAGHSELAARLTDVQFELVHRLVCYLSDLHTDTLPHSLPYRSCVTGLDASFTLPSSPAVTALSNRASTSTVDTAPSTAATSNNTFSTCSSSSNGQVAAASFFLPPHLINLHQHATDHARQARARLIKMPSVLLEELAADLYDEVDRRELEAVIGNSEAGAGERCTVPFLPVNPLLSSTRNQARQKLARLREAELCSLVVDLLVEARRRAAIVAHSSSTATRASAVHDAKVCSDSDTQKQHNRNQLEASQQYPPPLPRRTPEHHTQHSIRSLTTPPSSQPSDSSLSTIITSDTSGSSGYHSHRSHAEPHYSSTGLCSYTAFPLSPIQSHANSSDTSPALHRSNHNTHAADQTTSDVATSTAYYSDPLAAVQSSVDVADFNSVGFVSSTNTPLVIEESLESSCDRLVEEASSFVASIAAEVSAQAKSNVSTNRGNSFLHEVRRSDVRGSFAGDYPQCPRNSGFYGTQYSNPTVDASSLMRASCLSEDSLDIPVPERQAPVDLYLPLAKVTDCRSLPGSTLSTLESDSGLHFSPGFDQGGIHPPLSPDTSMIDSGSSFYLRQGSELDGINPPLSPEASIVDSMSGSYVPLGSVGSGIHPPLSPQASAGTDSTSALYASLGRIPSGINPPLTPQTSMTDSTSGFYVHVPRIPSGINPPLSPQESTDSASGFYIPLGRVNSGINPPLSPQASTIDTMSGSYVPLGSINSGIHPALTPGASSVGSRATFDAYSSSNIASSFGRNNQNNPLYQSYDTVNISSDEMSDTDVAETKSLDEGRIGDTEDNSEVNMTEDEKLGRKNRIKGASSKKGKAKKGNSERKGSVRRRIREGFEKVTNPNRSDENKSAIALTRKEKYSSGFSSDSNISSEDGSTNTFVGSGSYCSSVQRSESVKSPAQSVGSTTSQFAAQLSRSIRQKLMGSRSNGAKSSKENRKSEGSNIGPGVVFKTSPSEAIAKSRSLPADKNNLVREGSAQKIAYSQDDKARNGSKNADSASTSSKSRFVRTLTMPLKLASQRRQSLSRVISHSQPTTPEMSRKHRIIQSYTRPRTNTNVFAPNTFSNPQHRIRDPLSLNYSCPQPASSVRSLFSPKEKNSIKHISKPIIVADPQNFQRLTASTKSLMSHREKNYVRPLVKSFGLENKPPIASRPAPHHSSENLHRIHLKGGGDSESGSPSYDPPPFINSPLMYNPQNLPIWNPSSSLGEGGRPPSSGTVSDDGSEGLMLEVCNKCRQNVADGLQHPSIWGVDECLPRGYTKPGRGTERVHAATAKRKNSKEDCKLQ